VIRKLKIAVTKLVTRLEDVHSKKRKSAAVWLAVDPNVSPMHKAHVRSEGQVGGFVQGYPKEWIEFGADPGSMNVQNRHRTLEVEYGRGLCSWSGQEQME
jgi:hypothetical protein